MSEHVPLETAAATYRILRDELLQKYPELAEDETALLDTLEGLTTVNEQITALLRSAVNDEFAVEGMKQHIDALLKRRVYMQGRADKKRRIALHYMEDCGIKLINAPDMTISQRAVAPSVVINDVDLIPDNYMRVRKEPDKTAIKDALKNGQSVPGCSMSNGGSTIAIKI